MGKIVKCGACRQKIVWENPKSPSLKRRRPLAAYDVPKNAKLGTDISLEGNWLATPQKGRLKMEPKPEKYYVVVKFESGQKIVHGGFSSARNARREKVKVKNLPLYSRRIKSVAIVKVCESPSLSTHEKALSKAIIRGEELHVKVCDPPSLSTHIEAILEAIKVKKALHIKEEHYEIYLRSPDKPNSAFSLEVIDLPESIEADTIVVFRKMFSAPMVESLSDSEGYVRLFLEEADEELGYDYE